MAGLLVNPAFIPHATNVGLIWSGRYVGPYALQCQKPTPLYWYKTSPNCSEVLPNGQQCFCTSLDESDDSDDVINSTFYIFLDLAHSVICVVQLWMNLIVLS